MSVQLHQHRREGHDEEHRQVERAIDESEGREVGDGRVAAVIYPQTFGGDVDQILESRDRTQPQVPLQSSPNRDIHG